MAYEGATGWLIGEENHGLAAMFTMMNAARLHVGMEGVGVAEAAFQKALDYAKQRKQGGAFIIEHPDIRRMLLTMRAKIQAGRAMCYACAVAADRGDKAMEDVLTPIAKAWSTDLGVEASSLGVQVHGGMGFVEEAGAAQYYRDARIAPIYEGTNGIQAIDLYGRKLLGDRGEAMGRVIAMARDAAAQSSDARVAAALGEAATVLEAATEYMLSAARADALAGASAYLGLAGDVIGGALLARGVAKSNDAGQAALLAFYAEIVLARAGAYMPLVKLTAAPLAALG
jgi:predicted nucleic acid-binding protein